MSAVDIHGRDLGSATGSAGPVGFAPINLGLGAGLGASSGEGGPSPLLIVGLVIAAAIVLLFFG